MRIGEVSNDKDLIQAVDQLRKERLENRRPFEEIWWNNIALIAGDHYARWDPLTSTWMESAKGENEVRIVINQARVVARTELAKLTKSRPVTEVIPKSSDIDDMSATRVGSFVLDAMEWEKQLRLVRKDALWWTVATGLGSVSTEWNPQDEKPGKYEFLIDPATGEPCFDPVRRKELLELEQEGQLELYREEWPLGDLKFTIFSPFQLLPDDTVTSFAEIKDLITTEIVDIDIAKDTWKVDDLREDESDIAGLGQRMLRRTGLERFNPVQRTSSRTVQVHTYWLPKGVYGSEYLRDGLMVRWANGYKKLEIARPFPYQDNRIPHVFFEHIPNATAIWPDAVITDVREPNLELDRTVSQLLENRDYMVNPMWVIAEQCQVRPIKSQPGGMIRYVHVPDVPPPTPNPGVPLPTQIENLVIGLRDQILDLSGQGEVSRGRIPSGVRAGVMMQYLQEEDETKIGTTADNIGFAVARMGSMILSRVSQFYTTHRIMRAYRPGRAADVRRFKGADLKGQTDVVYVEGSAHTRSKAARQQNAMTLIEQEKSVGERIDAKQVRDILELGEGEPDDTDLSFAQAERENEMMVQSTALSPERKPEEGYTSNEGQPAEEGGSPLAVPVFKWHNHEAHLKIHYRYMMMPEFEQLRIKRPDIGRLFDEHTAQHEQALQEIQMQQIQMMMAARGGPEGTQPGSGQMPLDRMGPAAQPGEGGG